MSDEVHYYKKIKKNNLATNLIGTASRPRSYTRYTIMPFPDWRSLQAFAKKIKETRQSAEVELANENFRHFVERVLNDPTNGNVKSYGLFGKQPKSYAEAMSRNTFLYYDEYKEIKKKVEKKITAELQKSSVAEAMKPRLVYNDKQIGEFIFDKAAMSLQPEIFYYSPSKNKVVNAGDTIQDGNVMVLNKDKSVVVFALRVETDTGDIVYVEANGEKSLEEASKLGTVTCTSSNKKVFLYKEKKPRQFNSIKIIVGLTAGGFTNWANDFYTGVAAGVVIEVLESLGYSVAVEIVMGGGRCGGCYRKLNFDGNFTRGRRFFSFSAKTFDEQPDMDGLLYTLCDPSFHNIKFISLLNYFFTFFGDQIDTNESPAATWHGIESPDMVNPIGIYQKYTDYKKGNKNLLHFYIHKVKSEDDVIKEITDLVLTCENINLEAIKKYSEHDFGIDA